MDLKPSTVAFLWSAGCVGTALLAARKAKAAANDETGPSKQDDLIPSNKANKVVLYNNIICPFAHRAVLALKEKRVDYMDVHIPLSGEIKKLESGIKLSTWPEGTTLEQLKKIKSEYKRDVNATGEVPTLDCGGAVISEADVVSEFVQDAYPDQGTDLLPKDALQRSKIKHVFKVLSGGKGVAAMYGLLKNQDPAKDQAKLDQLYAFLAFFAAKANPGSSFFLSETPSYVDIMLMPFYHRFVALLPHYRNCDFIPKDTAAFPWAARMQKWAAAVEQRQSFRESVLSADDLIGYYVGYAGARGVSTVFGK